MINETTTDESASTVGGPPLEAVVMRDFEADLEALFGAKIKTDDGFCENVWSALANKIWRNIDGAEFACTFRYAGGLIADIRGSGNYMDWYCSGPCETVTEEIENGMAVLGWSHHNYDDA